MLQLEYITKKYLLQLQQEKLIMEYTALKIAKKGVHTAVRIVKEIQTTERKVEKRIYTAVRIANKGVHTAVRIVN